MLAETRTKFAILAALSLFINTVASTDDSNRNYFATSKMNPCPEPCEVAGNNPSNWTNYHDVERLFKCNQKPKLLDFAIHNSLDDLEKPTVIRACSTFRGETVGAEVFNALDEIEKFTIAENEHKLGIQTQVDLQMAWSKTSEPVIAAQVVTAAKEIQVSLLHQNSSDFNSTTLFAHYGNSIVGVYVGGRVRSSGVALMAVQQFIDHVQDDNLSISRTLLVQHCGRDIDSDYVFGIIGDTTPGMAAISTVQSAVKSWSEAKCVTGLEDTASFGNSTIWLSSPIPSVNATANNFTLTSAKFSERSLHVRANCRTIQVVSGDGCASLANKCGISGNDITTFNPSSTFCSTLRVGQHVCCSSGTLPDLTPKPKPDGSCASYIVKSADWCDKIASENGLTVATLESLNKNTWGWSGCERLFPGINICLSSGDPPMPEAIPNAVCGPQKPGTMKAPKGTNLADLNPCPLKTCCNVWGLCGTTEEFCVKSSLGPPGTSEPGKSACISNCGMTIINNKVPPKQFISVGYFEAWNKERPCLHMDITQMNKSFTHIHFAFADVTDKFEVSVSSVQDQFDKFVKVTGQKRILAFGGWTASTHPSSFWIFREGVKPGNREILAKNLADFIKKHNLDGIDLDWEYPGAPDMPDIPAADPIDGQNYLELLKLIRNQLPDKSLSIAAPASFWYLKPFPIAEISTVVDYIIYMTYDLHGQWDYGNQWSSPGCPAGNCLRSHVNITETINSLAMITKAGVPTYKIIVGITSYGRSFRMTTPGCTGPTCTFTGPLSGATPGRCTRTSGYISNAEIKEIITKNPSAKTFTDGSSSNILIYDDVQWVAYMNEDNKKARTNTWRALNFGGVTDWAVDLENFVPDINQPGGGGSLPSIDGWRSLNCQHQGMTDAGKNAKWRWHQLMSDDAWKAVNLAWTTKAPGALTIYTRFVSNFFHGPEKMDCATLLKSNTCDTITTCQELNDVGPASMFILNSFRVLNNAIMNFYKSMTDAQGTVALNINDFIRTFSPKEDPALWANIMFNFVNMGLGIFAAPLFNNLLRSGQGSLVDNLKDHTYSMMNFAVSSAKDMQPIKDSASPIPALVSAYFNLWKNHLTLFSQKAFAGDKTSVDFLSRILADGKLIGGGPSDSAFDSEKNVLRMLYAYIIPSVWRSESYHPVLIDMESKCDEVGKGNYKWVSPSKAEKSNVCIDGKLYYLLAPVGNSRECTYHKEVDICHQREMEVPPGLESLDGMAWAGIIKEDLAKSAIQWYNINGKKNRKDGSNPDVTDITTFDTMYDFFSVDENSSAANKKHPAQAPGLVNIPVCVAKEVIENWFYSEATKKRDYNAYPCNEVK